MFCLDDRESLLAILVPLCLLLKVFLDVSDCNELGHLGPFLQQLLKFLFQLSVLSFDFGHNFIHRLSGHCFLEGLTRLLLVSLKFFLQVLFYFQGFLLQN